MLIDFALKGISVEADLEDVENSYGKGVSVNSVDSRQCRLECGCFHCDATPLEADLGDVENSYVSVDEAWRGVRRGARKC